MGFCVQGLPVLNVQKRFISALRVETLLGQKQPHTFMFYKYSGTHLPLDQTRTEGWKKDSRDEAAPDKEGTRKSLAVFEPLS